MLPLEEEVYSLLVGGFSIVMGVSMVFISLLLLGSRKAPYRSAFVWILAHLALFSVAVYFCLLAIGSRPEHPAMASENNSLNVGIGGVIWAVSMLCLLAGITSFTSELHWGAEPDVKED